MTTFGLVDSGFVLKRQEDIIIDLGDGMRVIYEDIDLTPDSVAGQFVSVMSYPLTEVWENLYDMYSTLDPNNASGTGLDKALAFVGLTRRNATRTNVRVGFLCENTPVTVPEGTEVSVVNTTNKLQLLSELTVDADETACEIADVNIVDVAGTGVTYTITINALDDYETAVIPGDTIQAIASRLAIEVNDAGEDYSAYARTDGSLVVFSNNMTDMFSIIVSDDDDNSHIELRQFGNFGLCEMLEAGAITSPAYTVTVIETPVTGLDAVINIEDGTTGLEVESDAAFRARAQTGTSTCGSATVEAIRTRLLNDTDLQDAGMSTVFVFENTDDTVNGDGLPPHSIHIIIDIPDSEENDLLVAEKIWALKGGGIQTYSVGDAAYGDITDSMGYTHRIYFDRPTISYVHVEYEVTDWNDEETLPDDYADQIANGIVEYGETVTIGGDLIFQRFYGPIISIPGIGSVALYIAATATTARPAHSDPEWKNVNIPIAKTAKALFAADRVLEYVAP